MTQAAQLIAVIYEDTELILLDKAAGMPVFPQRKGEDDQKTVRHWLCAHYPEQKRIVPFEEAGIVHRLDNDTSGILVVGKTQLAYDFLRKIWNTLQVTKEYGALVLGAITSPLLINLSIAHHPSRHNKMVVCQTEQKTLELKGRQAYTKVERLGLYQDKRGYNYSLVSVEIKTGVRHQIRAHLAGQGHPLAGDGLYQNSLKKKQDLLGMPRHFLHLRRIQLPHPMTGEKMAWVTEFPHDLMNVLNQLRRVS
ncbi:MAG TPA: hypothetical protein DDW49_06380 [Deltaproteobacteria bacterium]|nr:MAG: hypothetical protein A2048_02330 [Deltaproteobacteria bacterium GWA2_45_12]HBF13000.1 hypothetical protein [Deltaproteobacteria bacterium]